MAINAGHNDKLHLALIGLGNQGQEHLQGMQASLQATFVAGIDPSESQRQQTQSRYPLLQLFGSIEELALEATALRLDGLVLCLPHHCYADIWPQVAALQLPVLKEKPLARTIEEAHALTHQISGRRLKTAIQRRHHPSYRKLHQILREENATIHEAHAWLHLGRQNNPLRSAPSPDNWRSNPHDAGGGILLDAGYHLVDLVHYLVGPIELVQCSIWQNQQLSHPDQIEDEAQLLARNEHCWVMLDARLSGEPDDSGKPRKSEGIHLATSTGDYFADRSRVCKNEVTLWEGQNNWQQAMAQQLDEFALDIRNDQWNASTYWDQLPAMRLIEQAYQLSRLF